jgi:hypothetical protein
MNHHRRARDRTAVRLKVCAVVECGLTGRWPRELGRSERTSRRRIEESLAETWPILAAALVPAVILFALQLFGVDIVIDAWIAVIACTVLLTGYSFFAGRRGGLSLRGSVLTACIGALLGMLVIGLKAGLH